MRKPPTLESIRNDDDATRTCIMLLFTFLYRRCTTKNVKVFNCSLCGGRERKRTTSFFLSSPWTLIQSQNSISGKIFQHLTNCRTRWNGRDKTWSKWRFRNRCCCWAPYFATKPKVSPRNDDWGTERAGDWLKENHQCIFYAIFFIWNITKSQ